MIDLKTGRFVIDAEKGWEVHPFMTREEFMQSDMFKTVLNKKEFTEEDEVFSFLVNIDGYEMYMRIITGGRHNCVENISLISKRFDEINNYKCMPDNWEETAYEIKHIHDDFLLKETTLNQTCLEREKENWFDVSWGSIRSSFDLRYDDPYAEIVIDYRNRTQEEDEELGREIEELGDAFFDVI